MTRISQLIAVVGGVKADTTAQMAELLGSITQPALVSGIRRTYRARFEAQDQSPDAKALVAVVGSAANTRPPEESTRVQVTAEETLRRAAQLESRLLDVTRTLDAANTAAVADVRVGATVLWTGVPTSHLLFVEKELQGLHAFIAALPVRDQAEAWTDEGTDPGVWKTDPVEVASTKKVPFNHILAEGDQWHAAQVQVLTRDEVVGWKVTTKFSGALDPKRKRLLLDRLTAAREAVKMAREEANAKEVRDIKEGERFFDWLLEEE